MRKDAVTIDPELITMGLVAADRSEALKLLVGKLVEQGYVDGDFLQQAVDREDKYPTGLAFEHINIAIPHANPQNVLKSACSIGQCRESVAFRSMEEPEQEVAVELICVLALKDPNDHLALMERLIGMFRDPAQVQAIRGAGTAEALCGVFHDYLFKEELA